MATEPGRTYPSELPVLALRQNVVFPLTLQPLAINRPLSIESVNRALTGDRLIFLALQNNEKDEPDRDGRRRLFIEARLLPSGHHNLILTGQLGNVMQELARAAVSHIRRA